MSKIKDHDVVGIPGILDANRKEFEKKKLDIRVSNEEYLRSHPELNSMLKMFMEDVLNEYPENILEYAGEYFDKENLKEIVQEYMNLDSLR
jgi:hypothetical protein